MIKKIKKNAAYFHDGTLIDITDLKSVIVISMESAELECEDFSVNELSQCNTIRGKLHLEDVKNVYINDTLSHKRLKKEYDSGGIFDFSINQTKENDHDLFEVEISVKWVNYPPNKPTNEFCNIKITAHKIWWENDPSLSNPSW